MSKQIHITECPRDAMQGLKEWIPTAQKVAYLNALLKCGFDVLDFGSFVSPKAIPQMQDTAAVLAHLDPSATALLAIVANARGAIDACAHERIDMIGFPFSISETFQQRNTNTSTEQALVNLRQISDTCIEHGKKLRVYLSMGFGNPYGDTWSSEIVISWVEKLDQQFKITEFALSDTIGCATPELARGLFLALGNKFPHLHFAAHLHLVKGKEQELVKACIESGCRHFDTAVGGYGGCPMAKDELTGNLATEVLLEVLEQENHPHSIDDRSLQLARQISSTIF